MTLKPNDCPVCSNKKCYTEFSLRGQKEKYNYLFTNGVWEII